MSLVGTQSSVRGRRAWGTRARTFQTAWCRSAAVGTFALNVTFRPLNGHPINDPDDALIFRLTSFVRPIVSGVFVMLLIKDTLGFRRCVK